MPDDQGMQDTTHRIDSNLLHPTPVTGTTTVEWRSPQSGRVVAVTNVAPRGRKGLWDAMARAATSVQPATTFPTDAALAVEPVEVLPAPILVIAPGIHQPGETVDAHLDYLSRLSTPAQTTGTVAPVVSLAEYAAAKGKPFGSSERSREPAT